MAANFAPLWASYKDGYSLLYAPGDWPWDVDVAPTGDITTNQEILRRQARTDHSMVHLSYSVGRGFSWDAAHLNAQERATIQPVLARFGLVGVAPEHENPEYYTRNMVALANAQALKLAWPDGRDVRFLFQIDWMHHIAPNGSAGIQTATDTGVVVELIHNLGTSLRFRDSGHMFLITGRDDLLDEQVKGVVHRVNLPMPDAKNKEAFLAASAPIYTRASFAPGLTAPTVARLAAGTPNRILDSLQRESHYGQTPITAQAINKVRLASISQQSEGTLEAMDTTAVDVDSLVGEHARLSQAVLMTIAAKVAAGDKSAPIGVLLPGPPGVGKSVMVALLAALAGIPALVVNSPKGPHVGDSERRVALLIRLIIELGAIAFLDEIDTKMAMARPTNDQDSVSPHIFSKWLTVLADTSLAGRILVIGTTNTPWRISAAMLSRFTVIPVLFPLARDFPVILLQLVKEVYPGLQVSLQSKPLKEAAAIFSGKGASPRDMRTALGNALLLGAKVTPDLIVRAADNLCIASNPLARELGDLASIRATSSKAFLPWTGCLSTYPFPPHIAPFVDVNTGDINWDALERRVRELERHVNI